MPASKARERILVVDDSPLTLEVLSRNLSAAGFRVRQAESVPEAIEQLEVEPAELVITDWKMPGQDGLELVRHVRHNCPNTEVMVITGFASVPGAVQAMKTGAEEYLAKPFTDEELFAAVERSLAKLHRRRTGQPRPRTAAPSGLLGESRAMQKVLAAIAKAATTTATVLIVGESGTGKELVARAIHYGGKRSTAAFVPINCGGIPEGLLESELFGYVKGAFTGAVQTRAGFFQTADGGTIFLDEISEISPAMQVKLLRVLQDRQICMVGDTRSRKVDVRVLAATNKDLLTLIKKGLFREDLYFRLNVITIEVPPLRDREDDVLLLAHHFASRYAAEVGRPAPTFTDRAMQMLKQYPWPGNVRELENLVQRLVVMAETEVIDAPDLPALMRFSAARAPSVNRSLAEVEAEHMRRVLQSVGGNKSRAAEILGIDRKTLRDKVKRYRLEENE